MRVIIAGSRSARNYLDCIRAVDAARFEITEVISGTAAGADRLGERYAEENGITLRKFPADWSKHGKSAGYIRNQEMADNADALIALWDGESRGTKHMMDIAQKKGLQIYVWMTKEKNNGSAQ